MKKSFENLTKTEIDETIEYLKLKQQQMMGKETSNQVLGPNAFVGVTRRSVLNTTMLALKKAAFNPLNLTKHSLSFAREATSAVLGNSDLSPNSKDRRFTDVSWKENRLYKTWLQLYLAAGREVIEWIKDEDFHEYDENRVKFVAAMFIDGLAPSNSLLNPAALKRVIETGGKSSVNGGKNLISDLINHFGIPSSVDKSAFKVGKNIAATPGDIIFRNDIMELIQYKPVTEKIYKRPILIIPPQINKYYVFDLSKQKSVIKYLIENELSVFCISWKNPLKKNRNWNLDSYISAMDEAFEVIKSISSCSDINVMAACSGGVAMVSMLGYHAALKTGKVKSATLLVSVYDMGSTTDTPMGLFADEQSILRARKFSNHKGVLEGKTMARMFAWLRPNDLIWNYWINNYLLGNKPPAFDILYWNADTTNLAADFHGQLLELFLSNALAKPGEMTIKGTPIDLTQSKCDTFTVAGTTDHICPWRACYKSSRHLGGEKEFILSASGHIQSILNLPSNPKASYTINSEFTGDDPDAWYETAVNNQGSWWEYWVTWIGKRSGTKKNAPVKPGNKEYHSLCDAPGTYVYE